MKKNIQKKRKAIGRREFLSSCGKMTGIGLMSSAINLTMASKLLAARPSGSINDYKGLVCVFLGGGCDSYNMLAPGVAGFGDYTATRGQVAIAQNEMHRIVDQSASQDYHLNGNMNGVRDMFESGDLSFVSNVGTLVEPLTLETFRNGGKRPLGLSSHFDQRIQWQNSLPNTRGGSLAGTGWVGRMSEVLNDAANNNASVNANIVLGGNSLLQTSRSGAPLSLNGGAQEFDLYNNNNNVNVRSAIDNDLDTQYSSIIQNHYNHIRDEAIEQNNNLIDIQNNTRINTRFPNTGLGNQLRLVAIYIKAHGVDGLNANRQTFLVGQGGYDMHRGVTTRLAGRLRELSDALNAFNSAMHEIGLHDQVVTYTASDFGRVLTANRTGTNHGWGGNHIVMGGAVDGGRVLGRYPSLALGSDVDIGNGRLMPTTSVDELHSSLAYWFGVDNNSEMETILPNIRNFWQRTNVNEESLGLFTRDGLANRSS